MLFAALALLFPFHAHAFTVQTFQPEGVVRSPRQARVVFSEPMVAFGDPRGLEPFAVTCAVKGKGVWEDTRTWIYEFETELPAGERCSFQGKADLKSDKGSAWSGRDSFSFDTGGPAMKRSDPYQGSQVEQTPAFLLTLDGPVSPASVEQNVYLLVEGMAERIPVKVLSDKIRAQITHRSGYHDYYGEEDFEANGVTLKKTRKTYQIAIQSAHALPADKKIQLVWGKGVTSPKGAATANDQRFEYRTEPEFEAKFHCERENEDAPCLPIGDLTLNFTAPISHELAEKITLRVGGAVYHPFEKKNDAAATPAGRHHRRNAGGEDEIRFVSFPGPFPPNAKLSLELPVGLKDDRGRALSNKASFPLQSSTGGYPPLAKFPAAFGILEAADPVLPVTLRKVEATVAGEKLEGERITVGPQDPAKLLDWVFRLHHKADEVYRYEGETRTDTRGDALLAGEAAREKFELPKPNGAAAFEVVGIPLGKKGFHVVEISSRLLGKSLMGTSKPMYVASGALVTNLAVHLKWGVESSLVWVTSLDDGKPVKGAKLRAADCTGKIVWEGKTDEQGTVLAADFPSSDKVARCEKRKYYEFTQGLAIVAEKGDDFSVVYSGWDNGIEDWRFHLATGGPGDETMTHTVFDRTLLRAGQTVHMKLFLREKFLRGIRYREGDMPKTLVILHSSGRKQVFPVKFGGDGVAEFEWKIPKEAELGGYSVYLSTNAQKAAKGQNGAEEEFQTWGPGIYTAGSFRVEEFRLPVMAGSFQWPKGALTGTTTVTADLNVHFLSGGGAAGLPVKLRAKAEKEESTRFPAFEGFEFANGGLKTGRFSRGEGRNPDDKNTKALPDQSFTLDQGGGARVSVPGIPAWDLPVRISLEAEYHDPNGAVQTVSRSTTSFPAASLVGIQPDGWVSQQDKVKFRLAVAGADGKPLAGRSVKASWLTKESFSHRKRIVGGFYAYENFEEIKAAGPACAGETDAKGILLCEGKAPASGNLVLVAETEDGGKVSRAHHEIFVAGADDWWFGQENDDRIDLLAEKKAYEPGETARFQVRSPFREATALVTVEREGVLERFVTHVDGKNPVLEVPVKGEYAPNVFISALLVRGRVADPKATALVDLARPSHKLGIAKIEVAWKAHRLNVAVSTDKDEFRVREKAKVKVHVDRAVDGKPASDGEVLLVAVDEALLELLPNDSWDLLTAMMGERPLRVRTSTAQSQVIGKRHFGLKALPPGGGGGMSSARELFDTLLAWKARLKLDGHGDATADVPMNDSLSSFRLVAVASEAADRFGTGSHTVHTRQDLMLFSGVSPLARDGDQTHPEVTVRNAGDKTLTARVQAQVNGEALGERSVELPAGASKAVHWDYRLPAAGAPERHYEFTATAGDASDRLKVTQAVEPALRESLLQGTLERVDGKLAMPVEQARGSLPGVGGVSVKLTRSLANNLDGVKRYMTEYPYDCLEQRTSKAVALRNQEAWDKLAAGLDSYIDGAGLFKYFPEATWGSDSLTSYVLSVTNEAGYQLPETQLHRVINGLRAFVNGTNYYSGFAYPAADLALRKLAAMDALSRYESFDPKWLSLIEIQPDLWPMQSVLDWYDLLLREQKIPGRAEKLQQVSQILRAKVEWRGTTISFKGGSPLWWLMNSGDEDANRLLLLAAGDAGWNDDIGRVARGSVGRLQGGHWDLTTANAWGVLAMERFSEKHEQEPVSGVSQASLAGKTSQVTWPAEGDVAPMTFPWPKGKSELAVTHDGKGKPWAFLEARAAVRLAEPIFKGYQLKRTVTAVDQKVKGKWSAGDVYRVRLEIAAPSDMTWVVVSDPVPAGATVLGSGLGGESASLTGGEKNKGWGWGHEERSFSGFRDFFEWLPRGNHQIEYTVRLNQPGVFQMPNTRIEAMYAPEMYAESPNDVFTVL